MGQDPRVEIAARIIRACRQEDVFADETAVAVIAALDAAPRVVTDEMVEAGARAHDPVGWAWADRVKGDPEEHPALPVFLTDQRKRARAALTAALDAAPREVTDAMVEAGAKGRYEYIVHAGAWEKLSETRRILECAAMRAALEKSARDEGVEVRAAVQEAER